MVLNGVIIRGIGGFYYVKCDSGIFECRARGVFRKEGITPLVGDRCRIEVARQGEAAGNVIEIFQRKNCLVRPPVANIDKLAAVCAAASPEPDTLFIDKLFVIAESCGIRPVLIINKTDLTQGAHNVAALEAAYKLAGYSVIKASAKLSKGVEEIKKELSGGISAVAGASGVGKSSLLNLIIPNAGLKTGEVSRKTGRGKHTTRHVELLLGDGLMIMDTPGFGSLEISGISAGELEAFFPEFGPYIGACRFRSCTHINEPGCAVKAAVDRGDIALCRHLSYVEFYNSLKDVKEWDT